MRPEEAVTRAKELLPTLFAGERIEDVLLEGVERKAKGGWRVTLSFSRPVRVASGLARAGALARVIPPDWEREYKWLDIDATGEVFALRDPR